MSKNNMKSGSKKKAGGYTKTDAPPPPSKMSPPSSIADLVEQVGLRSSGISEVVSSGSPMEAVRQTITHPIVLAIVVGGLLMAFGGR